MLLEEPPGLLCAAFLKSSGKRNYERLSNQALYLPLYICLLQCRALRRTKGASSAEETRPGQPPPPAGRPLGRGISPRCAQPALWVRPAARARVSGQMHSN